MLECNVPVLLLAFNRPNTTQRVFDQIKQVRPKYLYVSVDGARPQIDGEAEKCEEVKKIIEQVDWDCEVKTFFRDKNYGCGVAPSDAITWFFNHVDMGIILEDDCCPDLTFFSYCSTLLEKYKNVDIVKVISGTTFKTDTYHNNSYYFTKYANMWGWATWKRVWEKFNFDIGNIDAIFKDEKFTAVFDSLTEKRYWHNEFIKTKNKPATIWDYQLLYTIWRDGGMSISPNINLIKNIGFDNNATHDFLFDSIKMPDFGSISFPLVHPQLKIDKKADRFIFLNVYSHSARRLMRLLKQNGFAKIFRYLIANYSIFNR